MNYSEEQVAEEKHLIALVGDLLRIQTTTQDILDRVHGRKDTCQEDELAGAGPLAELRRLIDVATKCAIAIQNDVGSVLQSVGEP